MESSEYEFSDAKDLKFSIVLFSDDMDIGESPGELSNYEACSLLNGDRESLTSVFRRIEGANRDLLERNGYIDVYMRVVVVGDPETEKNYLMKWLGVIYPGKEENKEDKI